ncbi:phosphoglycerate kinase (plasmid) [Azospirillum sp. B510]|uniref:phosphoglycerate kinase n=1 Tax=Alphaproteobacteria TaxID=28211 RepID=UPI0001C4C5C8|nr:MULTISPECIES: phosphoglycerate kinase [Alphaproteobacteria]BAI74968.1 phosphoglycerate kinase [Azospirillum sp. B510]
MVTTDVHRTPAPRLTGRLHLITGGRDAAGPDRPHPPIPAHKAAQPAHAVCAIVGGTGLSAKLELLRRLVTRVDVLALGGGIANSLLAATGTDMGASLCDHALIDEARKLLDRAKACGCEVLLPVDAVVATEARKGAEDRVVPCAAIGPEDMVVDIGPATVARLTACVEAARTVVWTGPLGVYEIAPFDGGTNALAWLIARRTRDAGLQSVAAGDDTIVALASAGVESRFSELSTRDALPSWLDAMSPRAVPA